MSDVQPTHLDLFSGIGGFALAARWAGFRTVGFCEIKPYAQRVLAKNFPADTGHEQPSGREETSEGQQYRSRRAAWREPSSRSRIHPDIFDFDGTDFRGVTLITGGFPCQPFSYAGKRRGKEDNRHLWPEMLRVIKEARPAWVLGENVAGIIGMELDSVLSGLEGIGYACRPFVIPACGVDARHRRNRVWIVAYSDQCSKERFRQHGGKILSEQEAARFSGSGSHDADTNREGLQKFDGSHNRRSQGGRKRKGSQLIGAHSKNRPQQWLPEPDVGRVAHGVPKRVDRLRGLGNAIVPQVAYQILKTIAEIERWKTP